MDIPVIMLTGVREAIGEGFSKEEIDEHFGETLAAYIEKPVDPGELHGIVASCLGA